tara:strand:+ start:6227 stop:10738 length:4512 start_codon:yes stop_codon:yes gene_type:complete
MLENKNIKKLIKAKIYNQSYEHDSCGVGLVASINGENNRNVVEAGIKALKAVWHRGAVDADGKTGDGAGIQIAFPQEFFKDYIRSLGVIPSKKNIAVGMIFLPRTDMASQEICRTITEREIINSGNKIYCWRSVPVNLNAIGQKANDSRPEIEQIFFENSKNLNSKDFEKELFILRRKIEKRIPASAKKDFYICSLSSKSIVYKGMFLAEQIDKFFPDLNHKEFISNFAIFHQRYSTNTFPTWSLAQPFRVLAHNGEINTIQGNTNWSKIHESKMFSETLGEDIKEIFPIIQDGASDSAALDSFYELLLNSGKDLPMIKALTIPESKTKNQTIKVRDFYEYCYSVLEPWDGPAAIAAYGNDWVIAGMDRNGFRPMRYTITKNDILFVGSETGMVELNENEILEKGHLAPGQMIGVDLKKGKFFNQEDIKNDLINRHPYDKWLKKIKKFKLKNGIEQKDFFYFKEENLKKRQMAAGWNVEDLELILDPMSFEKNEAIGSMGDDTPITLLSKNYRGLYPFFRQNFSQVTNPPMDSLRETNVMSLNTRLGNLCNILEESEAQCNFVLLESPFLFTYEYEFLKKKLKNKSKEIDCIFSIDKKSENLERSIKKIQQEAEDLVRSGVEHILLTDRKVNIQSAAIPMPLAVGAVHTHLVNEGLRSFVSINVQASDVMDVHSFAVLIGVGATTVNPYLAERTILNRYKKNNYLGVSHKDILNNYKLSINKGILKTMSKMGISVLSSYRAGYNFEVIGLNRTLVADLFPGMPSRISGLRYHEIENKIINLHSKAFNEQFISLPIGGYYKFRKNGENHYYQPTLIHTLQSAVISNSYDKFKVYSKGVDNLPLINIRDLFAFRNLRNKLSLSKVESESSICKRFGSGSMSHGALSKEAHETLAIAMNRMGAYSCSGEGGEDKERFKKLPNGDSKNSRVKQIASGRFGVTAEYLNNCKEIEIKMAQGAKPGEGGQLPGFKVSEEIAKLRYSTKGVTLISPPPHHDIYSIEDLAQLIYDLKQINPEARVCVKLVSRSGIGTIAAGVAKAKADTILISGHSGGTGASPQTSIKYAGTPWELGLSEVHQILVANNLRHKVRLRTDGGIKTGKDIIIASILGAEEYGIGTTSLVAMGCILVRQCHSDVCPVGICTQKPELRKKFEGTPEKVVNLFSFIARETREFLSKLGFKSINEIIGRTELLRQISRENINVDTIDLNSLLVKAESKNPVYCTVSKRNEVPESLDKKIISDFSNLREKDKKKQINLNYFVKNTDRAIGAKLSSFITKNKEKINKDLKIQINLNGSAGQSLGVFMVKQIEIIVNGDANDYVGKGLSGGKIIIKPNKDSNFVPQKNIIIGNTVLYGATSGELYANGQAGERFAVRNSGADAVIEGCSNNGCEYMTGGKVVILGNVGENFAAGMTGGMAFIYDKNNLFPNYVNKQTIIYTRLEKSYWENVLKKLIKAHIDHTNSVIAKKIIKNWANEKNNFWQIVPEETINMLEHPLFSQKNIGLKNKLA